MALIKPGRKNADVNYIKYALESPFLTRSMLKNSRGGTQKFISLSDLRNLKIPLPPVSEQKRIAAVLDQAYDLVNLRQKALDKLNTLGPSIFHEMFGDLRTNSKNYPRCKLGELIKVNSGQGLTAKNMVPGDFPVYGGNGINGYHNEGPIQAGRIIIGRVGVYCGSVHVTKTRCWVTDNALLVKKIAPCNTTFLSEALKAADLNQYAGRSSQPLISGNRLYQVSFILPPDELQQKFDKTFSANSSTLNSGNQALRQSKQLFEALKNKIFKGEF